jgi:hypothetical protein
MFYYLNSSYRQFAKKYFKERGLAMLDLHSFTAIFNALMKKAQENIQKRRDIAAMLDLVQIDKLLISGGSGKFDVKPKEVEAKAKEFSEFLAGILPEISRKDFLLTKRWLIRRLTESWKPDKDPISSMQAFQGISKLLAGMGKQELQAAFEDILVPHIAGWGPISLMAWYKKEGPKALKELIRETIYVSFDARVFKRNQSR